MSSILVPLLALTLAAGKPFKVETWHDRAVDFDRCRTFDWAEPPPPGSWSRRQRGFKTQDDEIRDAIAERLRELGYVHDDEGEVDFLVAFELRSPDPRRRRGITGRGGGALIPLGKRGSPYDNVLYVELRDPATEQPIWRGRAGPILIKKEDHRQRLKRAIGEILAAFPPPPYVAPARASPAQPPAH
ncbi:MAG: DUF4136 domain-containing protein [Acidobacteria bacterium]|nr:MAG: DUF4136 domain-containing protein [Acidobacteriota bacterium]